MKHTPGDAVYNWLDKIDAKGRPLVVLLGPWCLAAAIILFVQVAVQCAVYYLA